MRILPRRITRAAALLLAVAVPAGASAATEITVKGSDTLVVLMKRWAQEYTRLRPGLSIQVTGGGTGTGMAALVNRTTDICMASRPIRIAEVEGAIKVFGTRPKQYDVALDALVVYVNEVSPVTAISLGDLAGLFAGASGTGSPSAVRTCRSRSTAGRTARAPTSSSRIGSSKATISPPKPRRSGTAAVLAAVASDPNGIGYGGVAFREKARHLAIRTESGGPGVSPTRETVVDGLYPIRRLLSLYLAPAADRGVSGEFARWILSDSGQAVVEEVGFFALPPSVRSRP